MRNAISFPCTHHNMWFRWSVFTHFLTLNTCTGINIRAQARPVLSVPIRGLIGGFTNPPQLLPSKPLLPKAKSGRASAAPSKHERALVITASRHPRQTERRSRIRSRRQQVRRARVHPSNPPPKAPAATAEPTAPGPVPGRAPRPGSTSDDLVSPPGHGQQQ